MKRRWPLVSLALMVAAFAVVFGVVLLSSRRLHGSIPGNSPILSLGVIKSGFALGTTKGVLRSSDGIEWERVAELPRSRALVASGGDRIVVLSGGLLQETTDLKTFSDAFGAVIKGVAIASDGPGNVYVAESPKRISLITKDHSLASVRVKKGPAEIVTLGAIPGRKVRLFAGGVVSGFWISGDGGITWLRNLKTPTRAVVVDPINGKHVLIGTAGGILSTNDGGHTWRFTDMRSSVEALAYDNNRFYAVDEGRLVWVSRGGNAGWKPIVKGPVP